MSIRVIGVFIAIIVAVLALGITKSIQQTSNFSDDCHAAGGTVYKRGDWLCIDHDGRILPVSFR